MRSLFPLFLMLLLCGCTTGFPQTFSFAPPDQRLYLQGMEEWEPGENLPAAFVTLWENYPESPWALKARTVTELPTTIRNQQNSIQRLERNRNSCRQEKAKLQQQKKTLENDRERLKKLLIELEKRR